MVDGIGLAIHEYGHIIDMATLGGAITGAAFDAIADAARTAGVDLSDSAAVSKLVHTSVSGYGLASVQELIAEAFADVLLNGAKASVLSTRLYRLLEQGYREKFGTAR
jgi:hypothetical protein